jgi:hypothetical protein
MQEITEANAPQNPVTPAPTPAPAAPVTTLTSERVEPDLDAQLKSIDALTPAQSRAIDAQIRNLIPRDSKGKALASAHDGILDTTSEPAPERAPVVTPAPEPAPTTGEPAPEPTLEPTATPEPTPAPVPEPTTEPEPTDGKLPQHRTRAKDSFDDQVLRRYNNAARDGNPLSMETCVAAEKAAQGIIAPAQPQVQPERSVEKANIELSELVAKRETAASDYDNVELTKLTTAIEEKREEIRDIREDRRAKDQAATHQRQTEWNASMAKAQDLYPDIGKAGTKLNAAKDRIYDAHKANNDPIISRADYPIILAQMAAAEERIAPKAPGAPVSKPASTRSVTPAKPAPPLASASARTTQNGTGTPTVAAYLDNGITLRESKEINKQLRKLVRR